MNSVIGKVINILCIIIRWLEPDRLLKPIQHILQPCHTWNNYSFAPNCFFKLIKQNSPSSSTKKGKKSSGFSPNWTLEKGRYAWQWYALYWVYASSCPLFYFLCLWGLSIVLIYSYIFFTIRYHLRFTFEADKGVYLSSSTSNVFTELISSPDCNTPGYYSTLTVGFVIETHLYSCQSLDRSHTLVGSADQYLIVKGRSLPTGTKLWEAESVERIGG